MIAAMDRTGPVLLLVEICWILVDVQQRARSRGYYLLSRSHFR
jgi:hypothetical protein